MYYRRKILLALLQEFGNKLEKMRLQKLLFLLSRFQKAPAYHFVPYQYGCFSFQSMADIRTLEKYNILEQNEQSINHISSVDYMAQLKPQDGQAIRDLKKIYGSKSSDELVRSTYISHPYYAINSVIARDILDSTQYQKVLEARPTKNKIVLFTIGYEGSSLEEYLNKLIRQDVRALIDVRNNPVSMKFGFTKSTLQNACEKVGIAYIHIPEVGIQSELRQELKNQADYNQLFEEYKASVLPQTKVNQHDIFQLLEKYERIALTCFEADICQCHRKPLAEAIARLDGWKYELKHI